MATLTIEDCVGDRSLGRLLRRITKLMLARVEARFADGDFGFTPWLALKLVHDGVAGNAGELARELDMTTGATTRLIDSLEEPGLLLRDRCCADRRVVKLAMTDAGVAAYRSRTSMMVTSWNEILADFETAEVDQLIGLLGKLLRSFESHETDSPSPPMRQPE